MIYITKYCPNCKKKLPELPSKSHITYYGCSLKKCPYCQISFIDTRVTEPALIFGPQAKPPKVRLKNYIMALFCMAMSIGGIIMIPSTGDWSYIFIPIFFGLGALIYVGDAYSDIKNHRRNCEELKNDIIESDMRLKNPDYAILLKKHGFQVPEHYLVRNSISMSDNNI